MKVSLQSTKSDDVDDTFSIFLFFITSRTFQTLKYKQKIQKQQAKIREKQRVYL